MAISATSLPRTIPPNESGASRYRSIPGALVARISVSSVRPASLGTSTVVPPMSTRHLFEGDRIGRREHGRDLPHDRRGEFSVAHHGLDELHEATVGDQAVAAYAGVNGAQNVLQGVAQLVESAESPGEHHPFRTSHGTADSVLFAWADEEAHFEAFVGADDGHLVEFAPGEQHRAAPLRGPVDRHLVGVGRLHHAAKGRGVLDARYLDSKVRPVGEALVARVHSV